MKQVKLILLSVLLLVGCTEINKKKELSRYQNTNREQAERILEIQEMLTLESNEKSRFALMEKLIRLMRQEGEIDLLVIYLKNYVENRSDDPYLSYYLLSLAIIAREQDNQGLTEDYYTLILNNYPDLMIDGKSIHQICLKELLQISEEPAQIIDYYHKLLQRFPDNINIGQCYYYLAENYQLIGEFDNSILYYRKFLKYPETIISGKPNAYNQIKEKMDFYDSRKSWIYKSRDSLVRAVKNAIYNQNATQLNRLKSVNFFQMSWGQDSSDMFTHIPMDLSVFLKQKIGFRADLEDFSTDNEAYLRTWGWSYRISVWYLYFRKIDFPEDPEINGTWEWAGIYFGERY